MTLDNTICEAAYQEAGRKLKIDREKCVVYGVKVLGPQSRNPAPFNHEYPRPTREAAINLMEGARCFVNHGNDDRKRGQTRQYQDSIGIHRSIREEGDGLYSDFYYNPKHALAEQLLWDAEHAPENVGFSIWAQAGKKRQAAHAMVVESIIFDRKSHSIDLVCTGATTNSLSESLNMSTPKTTTARALIREAAKANPKCDAAMLKIVEEEVPAAVADAAMPAPAEGDGADPMDAGFGAMLHKLVDQYAAGDIDAAGFISKFKDIDKAWTKLTGGEATPAADAPAAESQTPTLADLQEELRALRHDNLASRVCAGLGVVPGALLTRALKTAKDEAEMKQLVEEFKTLQPAKSDGGKARSAGTGAGAAGKTTTGGVIAESFKPAALATVADKVSFLRNGKMPTAAK